MTKKKPAQSVVSYGHNKGTIRDNALFALVRDPLFRQRTEKKLKGRGSYQRKAKHTGKFFEKPDYKISPSAVIL